MPLIRAEIASITGRVGHADWSALLQTVFKLRQAAHETDDRLSTDEQLDPLMHCSQRTIAVNRPRPESVTLQRGCSHVFLLFFFFYLIVSTISNVYTDDVPRSCISLSASPLMSRGKEISQLRNYRSIKKESGQFSLQQY